MEIQEKKLKRLLKSAMREAIHEERTLFYDLISEIIEDIGLAKAIDEGKKTKKVPKEEIYKILRAR
ncbi:MAG: hypothetical protein HY707_00500 [Ignavibacteriae bacterium]|nr:hypothetical protein [Ignavibacteriota bacterium]